jgi:hypothetical protein
VTHGTVNGRPGSRERRSSGGWEDVLATEAHLVAPGGEWRSEPWAIAVEQFNRAADLLDLEPAVRVRLLEPRRALTVTFPVEWVQDHQKYFWDAEAIAQRLRK